MNECSICLIQDIIENEKCINNCGHCFCKPCLDGWLNTGKYTCPMCIQPIQYFKHNSENYRLIKPTQINTNTTNIENVRIQFINVKRKYFLMLIVLTIISAFFIQCYFIYTLYEKNKQLKRLYNKDTKRYINIIKQNNLIDLKNMINVKISFNNLFDRVNCSIPIYYFNRCFY